MNRHEFNGFSAAEGAQPQPLQAASVELEQALLGSILLAEHGHATQHLIERIAPEDFAVQAHRVIFEAIRELARQDLPPSFRLLRPLLEGVRVNAEKTAAAYLADLLSVSAPPAHAAGYAKALRQHSAKRQLTEIAALAAGIARSPRGDIGQDVLDIMDRLDDVCATLRERRSTIASLGEVTAQVIADLRKGPPEIIRTGLTDVDRMLGGWHRKELTVIAARPSMGKSAFLFSCFFGGAKKGTSSLIFTMEMPNDMAGKRTLSDAVWNRLTPIPYASYSRRAIPEDQIDRLEEVQKKYAQLPISFDDQVGLSVSEIRTRTKRHIDRLDTVGQRLDCVVIDHLGKIKASDRYAGNVVQEVGETTNALAEMAKELDVAVICAHQLNRAVESRDNKRPDLPDLRNSGNVEQDAETVGFLYRPAYYLNKREDTRLEEDERKDLLEQCAHDLEFIIAKNRNGPVGTIDLYIDVESNVVRDGARK